MAEAEADKIKFNSEKRPGIPRGACFKGQTVFHVRARLWDAAKVEYDCPGSNPGAIEKYENYVNWMERYYGMLANAIDAGSNAVTSAVLKPSSEEGIALYRKVEREYIKKHYEKPPV